MRTYLKTILAVTGGVVGVGGGAVGLAFRKTSIQETPAGGGDTVLASSSGSEVTQETLIPDASEKDTFSVPGPEHSLPTEIESREQATALPPQVQIEEKKENCKVIDFSRLNDVFEYIIGSDPYTLVSCTKTNKDTDTSNKFPNQWKGLFPSGLFVNKANKFVLTTETIVLGDENITTVFSSELLSTPSITGKWSDIFQDQEVTFRAQQIDLTDPKSGKIFLFLIEKIESLIKK